MAGFVSHFTNRLDSKGRVSIPAPFRAALARDGFEGLYCIASPHAPAVDAGGNELVSEIETRLAGFAKLSADHDALAFALFGASETPKVDAEGRIVLSDMIREQTGVTDQITFVGLGYKFQLWEPERFRLHRAEAQKRALAMLSGAGPAAGGAA
ncbi:division/cell wall cluster transcriptional repressor MraZ [Microvirga tunisiensis]|uniref:Transcriptional regulator MraZ n=2 Tax=Pannonibacter tanglangensis TaxID=2750084 RepID=A0A7X5EZI6_9HYPH|nr:MULTISPECIES: division/cell wall cluster transcriptional repressor MraZ [unclassified Pannonibacter]NBN63363.1 division/cell wall cluster transcriptional repressor MraZ [Pannonibacter sp. XCT-34]NBN76998.1 division/cell wall cluster transcriptional repressor MraZ [Pannonibacter sp. XCT-53]